MWDTSLQITTGCSVVGAWLGAFPIPLDWDRPWQVSIESDSIHTLISYCNAHLKVMDNKAVYTLLRPNI